MNIEGENGRGRYVKTYVTFQGVTYCGELRIEFKLLSSVRPIGQVKSDEIEMILVASQMCYIKNGLIRKSDGLIEDVLRKRGHF